MKRGLIIGFIACVFLLGIWLFISQERAEIGPSMLEDNLEALIQTETPSIPLLCSTTSPIIYCFAFCSSCSTMWSVPGISGQYIEGSSFCTCGAQL